MTKAHICASVCLAVLLSQFIMASPVLAAECASGVTLGREPKQTLLIAKRSQYWFVRGSATSGAADVCFIYGDPGDIGVMGDWDGDKDETPAVFRPSTGTWYISNSTFAATVDGVFRYGSPGDIPIAGDWDGDGKDTIGVFRGGVWLLTNHNDSGVAEGSFRFGDPSDQPLTAYSSSTCCSSLIFRLYRSRTAEFIDGSLGGGGGQPYIVNELSRYAYGNPGDRAVHRNAAWVPTSASEGPGVFRPAVATWYLQDRGTNEVRTVLFGNANDQMLVSPGYQPTIYVVD